MAPSILDSQPTAPHLLSQTHKVVDRKIFPDGIKTSGQHPPLQEHLRPYSDFPKEITGESVWKAEDYTNNPERWVHVFNEEEIAELSAVSDKFIADKIPLTGISKVRSQCSALRLSLTCSRTRSLSQSSLHFSTRSRMRSSTAKASSCSKASPSSSGETTSPPWHTWA